MQKLKNIVFYIFAKIFSLFPLKNYIIFESNSDFCDNSKALYDYIIENNLCDNYKIYWAVINPDLYKKDNNYSLILKQFNFKKPIASIKFLYVITRAKYSFYTHVFVGNEFTKGQIRCFLMHGTSLKNLKNIYGNYFSNSSHAVVTSEFTMDIHNRTKNGIGKISYILGYPRNDTLITSKNYKKKIKFKLNLENFNKIIVWMPTFKHQKNMTRNDFKNLTNDLEILNSNNALKLNNKLKKKNACLVIKLHPAQDLEFINIENKSNIKWLSNDELFKKNVDSYELLGISDALITDFSSVYIDYLLIDKPIGFELSNIENYKNGLGFLVENPLDYMPGVIIKNNIDLFEFVNLVLENQDDYKKERKKIRNLYHYYKDANSSKRIVEFFKL